MRKFIKQNSYYTGIVKNDIGFPKQKINLIAGDTETKPYRLLGLKTDSEIIIDDLSSKNFLKHLDKLTLKGKKNICYFHNLKFDIQQLFLELIDEWYFSTSEIVFYFNEDYNFDNDGNIIVKIYHNKIWSCKIYFSKNRVVEILDSYAIFRDSLYKLSNKVFDLEHKKYKVDFESTNKEDLKKYLINDLEVQYDLSLKIIEFHKHFDIRISLSVAQMSSRVFKHNYLKEGDKIPRLPNYYLRNSQYSYHGGKNTLISNIVKKYKEMNYYDVNSLYPFAMNKIPNFLNCSYDVINFYDESKEGIYIVFGELKKCDYAIFYDHTGRKIDKNYIPDNKDKEIIDKKDYFQIRGLSITSYELKKALKYNLFNLKECYGIIVIENSERNPLKIFVNDFYEKKNKVPKDSSLYTFYKLILNSHYGKYIQNQIENIENTAYIQNEKGEYSKKEKIYQAGGMYNPLIASLITGFSRAYIFDFELKYKSIHTATDSIIINEILPTSKELGDWHLVDSGDILIFRNKCYVFFGKEIKYATHGFHSNIGELLKLYLNKEKNYSAERFINIKESKHSDKKIAGSFQEIDYKLNVNYGI